MASLDNVDLTLLALLQENARISNADMARAVDMAPSAVYERVRKLEAAGHIESYDTCLDPKALGFGLLAFVFVRLRTGRERAAAGQELAEIPGVQEVHHIAGEDCFLVKVRARDTDHLGRLLEESFHAVDGVEATRSTIALGTVVEHGRLPLEAPASLDASRVERADA